MPKQRTGDAGWVDNWDAEDAEIAAPRLAVPGPPPEAGSVEARDTPQSADPHSALRTPQSALSWREVFRHTPAWIWLISMVAAGGICMMFMTVMLIIGFGK